MKCIIICCLLVMGTAAPPPPTQQNKKIGLDDIERDNLKTEKVQTKLPLTNYHGFVAYKTANDYVRQLPRGQYLQADLSPPPLHQQQYHQPQQQQQYHHRPQQQQQQQYQIIPQFYYQQPVQQQNYQQYENLQYINDNSVVQQTQQQQQQQYYTPYVYLQQSPSTSIQTVIDPNNGHLRYIMYVPAYTTQKTEPTQNYETVAQPTTTTTDEQQYTGDTQYVIQSIPQQQQQQQIVPSVQYAEEPQQPKTRYFTTKHEPKSLLDSYVPSIYQIQYYKQQQQQAQTNANSIENLYKTTQPIGKTEYTKIKPQQTSESKTNLNYYNTNNYH